MVFPKVKLKLVSPHVILHWTRTNILPLPPQTLGEEGKDGYYKGRIAKAIVECVRKNGGVLSEEDLGGHTSSHDTPIKTSYRGADVWEMPPNGQGVAALMALNILEQFDFSGNFWIFKKKLLAW